MSEQFTNQGGVANSDPSAIGRRITSMTMRYLMSSRRDRRKRASLETKRKRQGSPHVVEYFHQVDDAYSYLAVQMLQQLQEKYDIKLVCHIVRGAEGNNAPEPELLLDLAYYDASKIAPHYELGFPPEPTRPKPELVETAHCILASLSDELFPAVAPRVGSALWAADTGALKALAEEFGSCSVAQAHSKVEIDTARRNVLGHYSGAMFYYEEEWYWGVDRLYHLEQRLVSLSALKPGQQQQVILPRPEIAMGPRVDDGRLTLEFYPSLRSPYTSIIYEKTLQLAQATGIKLSVRPVLPMVMRGVPATREKGFYIFADASREAATLGYENWGSGFYDPIGEPTRRCYALYPWACSLDKGKELLGAFLKAAFFDGINTNSNKGLQTVVESVGLDWHVAEQHLGDTEWKAQLEANRLAMYDFGSWGVPSYRLLNEQGETVLALWGQDRLWLFAKEIQRLLSEREAAVTSGTAA